MMNMCKEVIDYEQVKLTQPTKDSIMALLMWYLNMVSKGL